MPDTPVNNQKKTVLLYSVLLDSDNSQIQSDKNEILKGAENYDLNGVSMFVYQAADKKNEYSSLLLLEKDSNGKPYFKIIKKYDKELYSSDPRSISQVISDVRILRPAESYGLIFWGHASAIDPKTSRYNVNLKSNFQIKDVTDLYALGHDINNKWINIDEFADALPDNMFDYIWFDACYMSNIESIYQLRNKCKYIIGSPTEVDWPGMPYDLTFPYFFGSQSDLVEGAKAFFNYYNDHPTSTQGVATIAVVDMSKIEAVADICSRAYHETPVVPSSGLQTYSRKTVGPFYDFGQYTRRKMQYASDKGIVDEFDAAMSDFVIWKAATETDFNYRPIAPDNFSGISCYRFDPSSTSKKDEYYKTLDWYKRVY